MGVAISVEQQVLHPYYDHFELCSDQWLYASAQETYPALIQYYVSAPEYWPDISEQRVKTHFNDFELSRRFSIEAACELSGLKPILSGYIAGTGKNAIKEYLLTRAAVEYGQNGNSRKTAMFKALAASNWSYTGGFN